MKVLYGVLTGSCIHAAVISGHPLFRVQLYTPDSLQNKTYSTTYLTSDASKYLAFLFFFLFFLIGPRPPIKLGNPASQPSP